MPNVPPAILDDVPKKQRAKLKAAMMERAVLGYSFSWEKLVDTLEDRFGIEPEDIAGLLVQCIASFNDKDTKEIRDRLTEEIAQVLAQEEIKTLRQPDPFGRVKDFVLLHSTSSSFSQQRAMDLGVQKYGLKATMLETLFKEATTKTPYTTITVRDVKDKGEGEED